MAKHANPPVPGFHLKPLGIDHIVLATNQLNRLVEFYRGILNCPVERTVASPRMVQLRAGSALIDILHSDGATSDAARNLDHFCLRLEGYEPDHLLRYLQERGVAHSPVRLRYGAEGQGPAIYITDPDGNTIELKGSPAG